ncbi:MAG: DUF6129 family protein [Chromatiaceae bacterium]|jgi:hypothetical protein
MDPSRIDQIAAVVERAGLNEQTLAALRETFTDIHLTYCMDDDIGSGPAAPRPVREADGFRIYLVDGRDHCMRFTRELASATGLVLAEVLPDDGD